MENMFFDSFFNNTIEGIMIIEEGFIKDINSSMLDILAYDSKDEIIDKLATGILIPNISQHFLKYNKEIYEEISLVSKDGNIIPAIIKIKDLNIDDKDYKMVFILNLTELKAKESLLIEQSRMAAMGEMLSMIGHQWRQPLSSIASVISNLRFRTNLNKYDKQSFENKFKDIDKYLNYMSGTIDDFRNFFKTDKQKQNISLDEIINVALEMIEKPFLISNIKIINQKKQLKKNNVYKNEILQVVLNILNNSKDAFVDNQTSSDPTIKIEYKEDEKFQTLIISDNAGGIEDEIINKIFDPYFSTKNKKNGTGLGLYMSKTIIERHLDGEISVSNFENGCAFKIKIPFTYL